MSTTLADLDTMLQERGYPLHTWEMRGETIWIRLIASGGIDNPTYEWRELGTIEQEKQMILDNYPKREPPIHGYCERCKMYSSNMRIHNCEHIATIRAEEARHSR